MFSGFHKNKEPRKMDDARHVGVGEFYSAFSVVFAWHGGTFRGSDWVGEAWFIHSIPDLISPLLSVQFQSPAEAR